MNQEQDAAPAATPPPGKRRRNLIILGVVATVCLVAYGCYWLLYARYFESTDDCYVNDDLVQVTSEVPGTVIELKADDTQGVARDQLLVQLDPADAEVAMGDAEANLGRAVREVRTLFATAEQLRAQIADREVALKRAQDDYHRRTGLLRDGAVSSEELSHTKDEIVQMQADLNLARQQLNATLAQIDGTTVETNPRVLAAEAAVRDAALALRRTKISAPLAGVVARRSVQLGQRVAAGTPLMAVVPLDGVWVDANFKEVQLADMRVGQPVTLKADVYGGGVKYHGKLVGLSAGSGTAFALLPAQNASGNWIKIVQRVPVRVALDPAELKAHPLRVGLSMTVTVDIHDTSGAQIAAQVRSQPIPTQQSLDHDPTVESRIAQIIAANTGASLVAGGQGS
jgi:membrane fusion protein, multidrug efflux system